eukprot:gene34628-42715_t
MSRNLGIEIKKHDSEQFFQVGMHFRCGDVSFQNRAGNACMEDKDGLTTSPHMSQGGPLEIAACASDVLKTYDEHTSSARNGDHVHMHNGTEKSGVNSDRHSTAGREHKPPPVKSLTPQEIMEKEALLNALKKTDSADNTAHMSAYQMQNLADLMNDQVLYYVDGVGGGETEVTTTSQASSTSKDMPPNTNTPSPPPADTTETSPEWDAVLKDGKRQLRGDANRTLKVRENAPKTKSPPTPTRITNTDTTTSPAPSKVLTKFSMAFITSDNVGSAQQMKD